MTFFMPRPRLIVKQTTTSSLVQPHTNIPAPPATFELFPKLSGGTGEEYGITFLVICPIQWGLHLSNTLRTVISPLAGRLYNLKEFSVIIDNNAPYYALGGRFVSLTLRRKIIARAIRFHNQI
jgi:hypothetical protein